MTKPISRRALLRGVGALVSVPWLEAMSPVYGFAADTAPNRMAFLYVPNGKNMADWTPSTEGADYELPPILESLAPVKSDFMVLTGLTADKARSHRRCWNYWPRNCPRSWNSRSSGN